MLQTQTISSTPEKPPSKKVRKRKTTAQKSPSNLQPSTVPPDDEKSQTPHPPKRSQSNLKLSEDRRRHSHPLPTQKEKAQPKTVYKPELDCTAYHKMGFNPIPLDLGNTAALKKDDSIPFRVYLSLGSLVTQLSLKENIDRTKPRVLEDYHRNGYLSQPIKKLTGPLAETQEAICNQLAGQYVPHQSTTFAFLENRETNFVILLVEGKPMMMIGDVRHFFIAACNPWVIAAGTMTLVKNVEGKEELHVLTSSGAYPANAKSIGFYDESIKKALRETAGLLDCQIKMFIPDNIPMKAPEIENKISYSSTAQVVQLLGALDLHKSAEDDKKNIVLPRQPQTPIISDPAPLFPLSERQPALSTPSCVIEVHSNGHDSEKDFSLTRNFGFG